MKWLFFQPITYPVPLYRSFSRDFCCKNCSLLEKDFLVVISHVINFHYSLKPQKKLANCNKCNFVNIVNGKILYMYLKGRTG